VQTSLTRRDSRRHITLATGATLAAPYLVRAQSSANGKLDVGFIGTAARVSL